MATMTHNLATCERRFSVPVTGRLPEAPFVTGTVELMLLTGPDGRATDVRLRYRPTELEFQLKLPRLVTQYALPQPTRRLSLLAAQHQAVLDFAAPDQAACLPGSLEDLDGLRAQVLAHGAQLLDPSRYAFAGLSFEPRG